MGKDVPGQRAVQIDERGVAELFEWLYRDLVALLANHARFDAWSAEHERKEPA